MTVSETEEIMQQSKKIKKIKSREDIEKLENEERLKYEIADELGLLDKVLESGWGSLSAKETGRIGGFVKNRHSRNG